MAKRVKAKRQPGRAITVEELRLLMAACGRGPAGMRNRAFLALCYGAGLRCAEALALMPRQIERRADGTLIQVLAGKGNKPRLVGIMPELLVPVETWLAERKRLGLTDRHPVVCGITKSTKANSLGGSRNTFGKPISSPAMRLMIKRLATKAGIGGRVHVHGLRHGHATALAAAGCELRAVSGQLGHSSTATTDRYLAKLDPRHLLAAVRMPGQVVHQVET
jgi:integrase/recombinase XerC